MPNETIQKNQFRQKIFRKRVAQIIKDISQINESVQIKSKAQKMRLNKYAQILKNQSNFKKKKKKKH